MTNLAENRTTWFYSLILNQPTEGNLFNINSDERVLKTKLTDLQKDFRPLEFSSPVYRPITPEILSVVHTPNNPDKGGLFGDNVRGGPHRGLDIQADIGTGVLASEDGVVVLANEVNKYGNVIYVNHRGGYQTRYAHLSSFDVKAGDVVKKGQLIGQSGISGNAGDSLPHLHFEIRKINEGSIIATANIETKPVDPLPLIIKSKDAQKFFFEYGDNQNKIAQP